MSGGTSLLGVGSSKKLAIKTGAVKVIHHKNRQIGCDCKLGQSRVKVQDLGRRSESRRSDDRRSANGRIKI